jgi:YggT family protein
VTAHDHRSIGCSIPYDLDPRRLRLLLPLINAVQLAGFILTLVVLVDVVLSFFMSPYSSVRRTLDSLVDPLLAPIRRVVPPVGMFDFSPLVLIILIQIIQEILVRVLLALA